MAKKAPNYIEEFEDLPASKRLKQSRMITENPGNYRVKQDLAKIYGRFDSRKKMHRDQDTSSVHQHLQYLTKDHNLLREEYEALEHILEGIDHASLSLFAANPCSACPNSINEDEMYQALYVTVDGIDEPVFLNTSALIDERTSSQKAMLMYYTPPLDESGPSSNYSLVWIIKPAKKAAEPADEILPGMAYNIANFIAPDAFLTVRFSNGDEKLEALDITFEAIDQEMASKVYFELGDDADGRKRYAIWFKINDTIPYCVLPTSIILTKSKEFGSGKSKVKGVFMERKIHAKRLSTAAAGRKCNSQTDGVQVADVVPPAIPKAAYVWQIDNQDFSVTNGCHRPIQSAYKLID